MVQADANTDEKPEKSTWIWSLLVVSAGAFWFAGIYNILSIFFPPLEHPILVGIADLAISAVLMAIAMYLRRPDFSVDHSDMEGV